MAAPMPGPIFQTLPACLGTFVIYTNQCTNKNVSLIFSVLTLFSPPAVVGCTGNHFSSQRLFKINFLCVRSDYFFKNLTLFKINCQGFLNSNFFLPTEILLSPWATGTILQSSFHSHRKWNHPSSCEHPFCIVRKWEQKTAIFKPKKIVKLHFTFNFFKARSTLTENEIIFFATIYYLV